MSVKAGATIFTVHNNAVTENHEMVVVKLKSADQKVPLNTAKHRIDEKQLKSMGEVSDLKPGASGELKTNLDAVMGRRFGDCSHIGGCPSE